MRLDYERAWSRSPTERKGKGSAVSGRAQAETEPGTGSSIQYWPTKGTLRWKNSCVPLGW